MSNQAQQKALFDRKAYLNRLHENINAWTLRAGLDLSGHSLTGEDTYRRSRTCTHPAAEKHGTHHAYTFHECRCGACVKAKYPPNSAYLR